MGSTGKVITITLRKWKISPVEEATDDIKPNLPGDPDYVPIYTDEVSCPVPTELTCPIVTFNLEGDTYQFSLPVGVLANPALAKVEVLLYDSVPTLIDTAEHTEFDPNFLKGSFPGLLSGTYTVTIVYRNNLDVIIHTCPDAGTTVIP